MKFSGKLFSVIALLLVVACKQDKHKQPSIHQNNNYLLKITAPLQDCDLVLRRGKDVTSYLFSQINNKDKTFSHCGIVFFENGRPYVYHAIGGEENPNQEMKREAATTWLSYRSNQTIGIARFKLSEEEKVKLKSFVHKAFAAKIKFDNQFSLASNDRYYCSEFVYKTMNAAFGNDTVFTIVNKLGRSFIPVENLYKNSRAKLVWQVSFK